MSVYALSEPFWLYSEESDRRFRRWALILAVPFLIIGLVIPFLQLAGLEKGGGQMGTARFAELIEEEAAPLAEEPEEPKPAEEPEPEAEPQEPAPAPETPVPPKPERVEPTQQQREQQAREVAQQSGVMAFADQLKDLRDSTLPGLDSSQQLKSSDVVGARGSGQSGGGNAFAESARASSGGIGSGEVRRQQGGTGLGERRTSTVERPAGIGPDPTRIGQGGDKRIAGRTLEEIQLVFDRNKGAFYTLYNRALRESPNLQGKVTVKISIAPSGNVTACEVVSSELNDPELERKIVARVLLLNFGRKDVESITIDYPLYFLPS